MFILTKPAIIALFALLGSAVVFALLAAVAAIVLCFKVHALEETVEELRSEQEAPLPALYRPDIRVVPVVESAPIAPQPVYDPNTACGEMTVFDVPDRTAAMLMAIVADELAVPVAQLQFLSIKEVK